MNKPLYCITDRDLLKSIAKFHAGFQPPEIVLEGLSEEHATAKPHGLQHSIADIVGHMLFWQDFFNRAASEGLSGFPEHAEGGWPALEPGGWDALRERYLACVKRTQQLALECGRMDEKLLPDDFPAPIWQRESIGSGLLHGLVHSSHHLGQIITLRQLLGLWPPQSGGMTW